MKPVCRLLLVSVFGLMLAHPLSISGQWNKKPYTEWSEKEAMKLLNDSPWGQTHTFTDMSKSFSTGSGSNPSARSNLSPERYPEDFPRGVPVAEKHGLGARLVFPRLVDGKP